MANVNSQRCLLAVLDGETNSFGEPEAPDLGGLQDRLPSVEERVEMFLRAMNGPNETISSEMRTAARERITAAMAADLVEKIQGWSPEETRSAHAIAETINSDIHIHETGSRPGKVLVGFAQYLSPFVEYLSSLLEGVSVRSVQMAAVPLAALFVVGTIWTVTWRDYNYSNQLEPSEVTDSNRSSLADAPATTPRTRSLTPAPPSKPGQSETEAELLHELANAKTKYGPSSPTLVPTLVDLASLYRSQGRYREAEDLCDRAWAIGQHLSDPLNPDIIRAFRKLAIIYRAEGRTKEAEALLKRADPR